MYKDECLKNYLSKIRNLVQNPRNLIDNIVQYLNTKFNVTLHREYGRKILISME